MNDIAKLNGIVECETPNSKTNDFSGTLYDKDRNILGNINVEAILMRGCVLRNTDWVYGLVVRSFFKYYFHVLIFIYLRLLIYILISFYCRLPPVNYAKLNTENPKLVSVELEGMLKFLPSISQSTEK
jgi:hypothetical protein